MTRKSCWGTLIIFVVCNSISFETTAFGSSDSASNSKSSSNDHDGDHYDYPELSVVPRASDRLKSEAEKEPSSYWTAYIPLQISAAMTLSAGATSMDSNYIATGMIGVAVGSSWLIGTVLLSALYHPYTSGLSEVNSGSGGSGGSTRDQLSRERAAEEVIRSASSLGQKLKWASVISNLGTSIFMLSKSTNSSNQSGGIPSQAVVGSAGQALQFGAAAMSFLPLLFNFHWHDVAEEQMDYKKRIYAPVASGTFYFDQASQKYVPGMALAWTF